MSKRKRKEKNAITFTDLGIKRLKPLKTRQVLYWDKYRGLSLLVSPGGTKTFRSTYKLNGKWQTRSFGRFGEMVPDADPDEENINIGEAHRIVANDRALARKGIDPKVGPEQTAEEKKEKKTFEYVVDQFIEHYAKPRQRTWDQTERILKNNCAVLLRKPIADIAHSDILALLRGFIRDGHPYKASITKTWLKGLWRWAFEEEHVPHPIIRGIRNVHIEKNERDRLYSDDEIRAIWSAAEKCDPVERDYVKLCSLLAPRKSALACASRKDLDDDTNPTLWTTPFELTKSRKSSKKKRTYVTPLPSLAQRIIKGLPNGDDRLFPGLPVSTTKAGQRQFNDGRLKKKLVKHGAPDDYYPHAFRHTIATFLQNKGHSEWEIGLVLNHSGSGVTAGYMKGYPLELKRKLLDEWADHVEELVTAKGVRRLR